MMSSYGEPDIYEVTKMELVYYDPVPPSMRHRIEFIDTAYELFRVNWHYQKIGLVEQSKLMLLNGSNRVLGLCDLTTGEQSSIQVDPKLIFGPAILANAASIVVARNNIRRDPQPTIAEKAETAKLIAACKLLGMELFDRIVFTDKGYYSYKQGKECVYEWGD